MDCRVKKAKEALKDGNHRSTLPPPPPPSILHLSLSVSLPSPLSLCLSLSLSLSLALFLSLGLISWRMTAVKSSFLSSTAAGCGEQHQPEGFNHSSRTPKSLKSPCQWAQGEECWRDGDGACQSIGAHSPSSITD